MHSIGIRREDKYDWERRVPLTPGQVECLIRNHSIRIFVQPSETRVFTDEAYASAGAIVTEDLSKCGIILGVKEIPGRNFIPGVTYVFFSHTIKGQPYNMPMLKALLDAGCSLIDYEKIVDETGRRMISFGRHAGLAGMIDALWLIGRYLDHRGVESPFSGMGRAMDYGSSRKARGDIDALAARIASKGIPDELCPFVVGFAGYGVVSQGAQEIFNRLPHETIKAGDLMSLQPLGGRENHIYKVVFSEFDTVERIDASKPFDLAEYREHPDLYKGRFMKFFPCLSLLMNCVFWTNRYPRLVTIEALRDTWREDHKLLAIGDISCDIRGAVECTVESTKPDDSHYVYDLNLDKPVYGFDGFGPLINAVDTLPAEIPEESSEDFGNILIGLLPAMAKADFSGSFHGTGASSGSGLSGAAPDPFGTGLPPSLRNALIALRGRLTPDFEYLNEHIDK